MQAFPVYTVKVLILLNRPVPNGMLWWCEKTLSELITQFLLEYIEIIDYVELTTKGYCKCMKWKNIRSLLKLAVVNDRLTEKQAQFLEKEFCREN